MKAILEINNIEKSYPQNIPDLEKLLLFVMENEISQEEIAVYKLSELIKGRRQLWLHPFFVES